MHKQSSLPSSKSHLQYVIILFVVLQVHSLRKEVLAVRPFGQALESPPAGQAVLLPGHHRVRDTQPEGQTVPKHTQERGCSVIHQKRKHCSLIDIAG